ncbi:MAG: PSD1 and planctomycete cytochrome C domain-containing protein, partial [Planctomycetota bacterium]
MSSRFVNMPSTCFGLSALALFMAAMAPPAVAQSAEPGELSYSKDVLPILSKNCFACHGLDENTREADLRLDIQEAAISRDRSEQPAIVPGDPNESILIDRIASKDPDLLMPPPDSGHELSQEQIKVLEEWIRQGAEYQAHWAFQKPDSAKPKTPDRSHPIDHFVLKRLAAAGLSASPAAEPSALLRRLSLDLIGLPPSLEELDAFEAAAKQNFESAYLAQVDRLLDSPRYGERWGRWWLDQARYADSNGYSIDGPRSIWKYRDWVVEALNNDMPFDQFTIEQLAGDLLPDASQSNRVATGFHRNTQINQEGGIDREQFRMDSIFDRVATTGTVWMGLTIGCAQCHDHKFDPISQKEYYQLFAFFNNQDEPNMEVHDNVGELPKRKERYSDAQRARDEYLSGQQKAIQQWLADLPEAKRTKLPKDVKSAADKAAEKWNAGDLQKLFAHELGRNDVEYSRLEKEVAESKRGITGTPTMVLAERSTPRETHVLIKGDFTRPSETVEAATPSILHALQPRGEKPDRLDLANWIVSPDNPLTTRVLVNRIWQVYFGKGIVFTENDFGTLGSNPTHPDLLDWLANEFQAQGWSLKRMHRLIVTSRTYQQSSNYRTDIAAADPENELLGRQQRLRLEAEIIRDVCLSVSGLLSDKMGGPPVYPPIPPGVMDRGQVRRNWKASTGEDRYRRGLYTFVFRATPPPSLNV